MPLGNYPKYYSYLPFLILSDSSSTIKPLILFLNCVLFVYVVDHGVNEGEPVDEQYCKQANEDQFRDPEPEGQYLDQDFPEGFEDGKFNLIL